MCPANRSRKSSGSAASATPSSWPPTKTPGAFAEGPRGGARGPGGGAPLPGKRRLRADPQARGSVEADAGAHRSRQRVRRHHRHAGHGLPAAWRRGRHGAAVVSDVRNRHPGRRRRAGGGAAQRLSERSCGHGREGDRPDPHDVRELAPQPDRNHRRPRRELEAFLAALPAEVLVVLDEAYIEFVRAPGGADSRDYVGPAGRWWGCGPSPRSTAWPGCASDTGSCRPPWPRC